MTVDALETAIAPAASLVVDSSAILASLDGTERVSKAAAVIFDSFIATGRNLAVISAVSVTEALVRPIRVVLPCRRRHG